MNIIKTLEKIHLDNSLELDDLNKDLESVYCRVAGLKVVQENLGEVIELLKSKTIIEYESNCCDAPPMGDIDKDLSGFCSRCHDGAMFLVSNGEEEQK